MRQLSQRDLDRMGLTVSSGSGKLSEELLTSGERQYKVTVYTDGNIRMAPDPGWNYNPGRTNWTPDLKKYDRDVAKLF